MKSDAHHSIGLPIVAPNIMYDNKFHIHVERLVLGSSKGLGTTVGQLLY